MSHVSPAQNCQSSPSPVRGGGSFFLNEISGTHISPVRHVQEMANPAGSPVLGSPSPGKGSLQNCSPLREGGHSPAKLFPSIHSPFSGKLRTPSPVMGRKGSYSPAKSSKSWLGLHKIPSIKMEGPEKRTRKSLSVPDLVIYIDDNR